MTSIVYHGQGNKVQVAGDFTDWAPIDMQKQPDGSYSTLVEAKPGNHMYKFVVDGEWLVLPEKPQVSDDQGNTNHLLEVAAVTDNAKSAATTAATNDALDDNTDRVDESTYNYWRNWIWSFLAVFVAFFKAKPAAHSTDTATQE